MILAAWLLLFLAGSRPSNAFDKVLPRSLARHHPWSSSSSSSSSAHFGQRGKRIRREKRRALQEPTPPRIHTPYGPIRISQPPSRPCDGCQGRGRVRCPVCEGRGVTRQTGTRKNNLVPLNRVVGSRWTSVQVRRGHRQYRVVQVMGSTQKKNNNNNNNKDRVVELRMRNCCGAPVDFWIPLAELKNKSVWRMGWTTLEEIKQANGGALRDACLCFRCKGERVLQCMDCNGVGAIETYEPLHN